MGGERADDRGALAHFPTGIIHLVLPIDQPNKSAQRAGLPGLCHLPHTSSTPIIVCLSLGRKCNIYEENHPNALDRRVTPQL